MAIRIKYDFDVIEDIAINLILTNIIPSKFSLRHVKVLHMKESNWKMCIVHVHTHNFMHYF